MTKTMSNEQMEKLVAEKKADQLLNIRNVSVMCGYSLIISGFTAGVVVATVEDPAVGTAVMLVGMVLVAFGVMVEKRIKKILEG